MAYANIAQLQSEHDSADLAAMEALTGTADPDSDAGIQLAFALGKAFADIGDFDRSFQYYAKANAGRRKQVEFPLAAFQHRLRHLRMAFRAPLFDRLAGAGVSGFKPIFIVGMPRSGSTLIEQILSSHPKVHGGGELPLTADVILAARRQHFRSSVADLVSVATPNWINAMARHYIRAARPLMGKKPRLADKYLDNFWNVGLLKLMFPDARIIHCVRDTLDNAVSIFRQHFADSGPGFAYDLGEIGAYFSMHDRLMRHWDEVLPGFVKHLRYEDVVGNLELMTRELLAFCDLPWDDRCLAFHQTDRAVKTASHAQVRKPLYRDAVGSGRPYLEYLGPLIEALDDYPAAGA
ncbi:MAG: sulfotransferase [Hyphomicrobiales bacterium]|nr:MAG: sulfotransferase [Hyphomicrobiales bacterium]